MKTEETCNHPYATKVCKKCGKDFCYNCCGSTNVDQGGKHEVDFMHCPHCDFDFYGNN